MGFHWTALEEEFILLHVLEQRYRGFSYVFSQIIKGCFKFCILEESPEIFFSNQIGTVIIFGVLSENYILTYCGIFQKRLSIVKFNYSFEIIA